MKFPPDPKTSYILDKKQDQRIFAKLEQFKDRKLTPEQEELVKLLYTQLETDWRTPLEEFVDKLLKDDGKNYSQTAIKAIGVFVKDGKTLASKGFDEKKNETFYRGIGGGVHFRETTQDAMMREVKEELGCGVKNLKLVDVVENVFTFNGDDRHQIVFLYTGDLTNKDLYKQDKIHIVEPYSRFDAEWIPIDDILSGKVILYPSLDWSKVLNKLQ